MAAHPGKRQRKQRFTGGMSKKTGYYTDVGTGEKKPYTYWQASREVPKSDLPAGVDRKRITGNGRTEREAVDRLNLNWVKYLHPDVEERNWPRGGPKLTLNEVYERWQKENREGKVSDVMAYKYAGYFKNHILPELGKRQADAITESDLNYLFNERLAKKTRSETDDRELLSAASRRNIYMALSGCLNYGVRHGYLPRNPLQAIKAPRKIAPKDDISTASTNARDLLAALAEEHDPDYCRWLFQFMGLRRAERLGLSWENVRGLDTDTPTIHINQQLARWTEKGKGFYIKPYTKTGSVRTIVLPEPFLSALRERKQAQDLEKTSPLWKPLPAFADLVFLQPDGSIYTLNRDNREWALLLKAKGLPHWRGHLNRHLTATWLAEQTPPVPMGTVRAILGHDSEAMAYYYAKTTETQQAIPMRDYGQSIVNARARKPARGAQAEPEPNE